MNLEIHIGGGRDYERFNRKSFDGPGSSGRQISRRKQGIAYRVIRIVELTPVLNIEVAPGESLNVLHTDFRYFLETLPAPVAGQGRTTAGEHPPKN